jgi:hypothetical protein
VEAAHRNAVVAIVSALSQTNDCRALERASHTIDRVAAHHKDKQDVEETKEIFHLYVRKLFGRAAQTCKTADDLFEVRKPLAQTLGRLPELADATGKLKDADINLSLAKMLIDECHEELDMGRNDCMPIFDHYMVLCTQLTKPADKANETPACEAIKTAHAEFLKAITPPVPPPAEEQ